MPGDLCHLNRPCKRFRRGTCVLDVASRILVVGEFVGAIGDKGRSILLVGTPPASGVLITIDVLLFGRVVPGVDAIVLTCVVSMVTIVHNTISVAWIIVRGLDIITTIVTVSVTVTVSVSVSVSVAITVAMT